MSWWDSVDSGIRAILANKLRSVLTMLGVIIGVGSVIAMMGIGEGTKKKAIEQLEIRGTNMITVMPEWGRNRTPGDGSTLRDEDKERIRRFVPEVRYLSGGIRGQGVTAIYRSNNHRTQINGVEPEMKFIRNATRMHSGAWFTEMDNQLLEKKAVLGYTVYEKLFGSDQAVGAQIKLNGQNYEVVGVVEFKGGSGWMNPDDLIYVPLRTAQKRLVGREEIDFIAMMAIDSTVLKATEGKIVETLEATRRNATGENMFRVMNQAEDRAALEEQTRLLSLLLAGIASVSLLVGGIGIMNIMLVSVTERTREIGLRKAIGARRGVILTQFLFESVVMCILGGTVGILLGMGSVGFVANAMSVPPVMNSQAILLAFVFSSCVGLFFGLYPAIRASKLEPIEALRYE